VAEWLSEPDKPNCPLPLWLKCRGKQHILNVATESHVRLTANSEKKAKVLCLVNTPIQTHKIKAVHQNYYSIKTGARDTVHLSQNPRPISPMKICFSRVGEFKERAGDTAPCFQSIIYTQHCNQCFWPTFFAKCLFPNLLNFSSHFVSIWLLSCLCTMILLLLSLFRNEERFSPFLLPILDLSQRLEK